MKILTQLVEILFYDMPAFFEEFCIEAVRSRALIHRHELNYLVNFRGGERFSEAFQTGARKYELIQLKTNCGVFLSSHSAFESIPERSSFVRVG